MVTARPFCRNCRSRSAPVSVDPGQLDWHRDARQTPLETRTPIVCVTRRVSPVLVRLTAATRDDVIAAVE
ncbi:MAG: hypothetical protein ACKOOG_03880, partial [Actinomycetota bacterium]